MQSDFLSACRNMRERMEVPPIPMEAIRSDAQRRNAAVPQRSKRRALIATFAASMSLVAVAAAAVWSGTHITYTKSGSVNISGTTVSYTKNPTLEQVRAVAREANFPVVLPSGLPAGTTVAGVARFGTGALLLQYNLPGRWRISHHLLQMLIANRDNVGGAATREHLRYTIQSGPSQAHWTVGHEEVTAMGYAATRQEIANIKRAMSR